MPYITVAVFLAGSLGIMWRWARVRVPLRITVTPAPSSLAADIFTELFFLKTLFGSARGLWGGGWAFHVALALALIGHVFGIVFLARQFTLVGASVGQSEQLSALFGGAAGLVMMVALIYLLYRRVTLSTVRAISDSSDYLVLVLVLSIVVTGNYMRFFMHVDLSQIRDYMVSLAILKPAAPASGIFVLHLFFVQLLLLYFPFSKLMHSCGIFFTRWLMGKKDLVSAREVGS